MSRSYGMIVSLSENGRGFPSPNRVLGMNVMVCARGRTKYVKVLPIPL